MAAAAAILYVLSTNGPAALHGQSRRPMSLVDLAELPRALDPQLSPDGRHILYTLSHADWVLNRPVWHIWRQTVGGGEPIQLTFGANGEIPGFTRWSPDGRSILFARDGQLFILPAGGGEPQPLTRHATSVSSPAWSPDGSSVYFLAADARTADERERDRLRDDVYAYDESFKQRHLWKVTVSTGGEQAITSGDFSVLSFRLSRDGRRIALDRAPTPLAADTHLSEIWTIDASGTNAKAVTANDVEELEPEFSPDNTQILFLADANAQLQPYYNTKLFTVSANGGTPRLVLADFPYSVDRATWTPDGRSILAVINMGVHSEIIRIDPNARTFTALTDGRHSIPTAPAPAWTVEPATGTIVFLLDDPTRFGEAYTLPIAGGALTRVTRVYDALDATFALPRQERYAWKGADGAAVEGILMYPADYRPGTRYPLVVQLHGGPAESDKFGGGTGLFLNYFPVLTGKGYVVLRPNYRGSAGYGDAAFRDLVGTYFRNMHLDVIAGVDALVKEGVADPDRLVLMGWSAGAHLANKLITFTDRFKAASAGAGAANWLSMYAQSDERFRRTEWFGGTPWQGGRQHEAYWNSSALKDVANAKTPTLFFAGESDPRVPMAQSVEMWRALRSHGVPTHLYVAPREGHNWGELRHLLAKANAELAWFAKYAGGGDYTPERAPDR
jgi:dipeptidyl aminopeptidase/acylaminoacyl peptidase